MFRNFYSVWTGERVGVRGGVQGGVGLIENREGGGSSTMRRHGEVGKAPGRCLGGGGGLTIFFSAPKFPLRQTQTLLTPKKCQGINLGNGGVDATPENSRTISLKRGDHPNS